MFQKIMFKPGKKSAPGAENKKKKRNKQDETTEVVDDVPFKKMSIFFKYLPYWKEMAVCRGVANHSRVAECTRLSPEGENPGVS